MDVLTTSTHNHRRSSFRHPHVQTEVWGAASAGRRPGLCGGRGTWKMRCNEVSTTGICKQMMWVLIKVIWHKMSERELGFGSQTINTNLLRLVQFWQYSALLQVYSVSVMSDESPVSAPYRGQHSLHHTIYEMCIWKVFDGTNSMLRILLSLTVLNKLKAVREESSFQCTTSGHSVALA